MPDLNATEPLVRVVFDKPTQAGQLDFMLLFHEEPTDEQIEKWVAWMGASFFDLWFAGGLGGSRFAPWRGQDRQWNWWFSPGKVDMLPTLGFTLIAPDVDPGALRVLSNVLEAGVYVMNGVVLKLVIDFDSGSTSDIAKLDFPAAWPMRPFAVEQYEITSRNFNVEIVFDRVYPLLELAHLVARIAAWLKTVQHGGFGGHPYAQWENGLELNEKPMLISGSSLLIRIQEFYSRSEAFDSLLNLLAGSDLADDVRIEQVIVNE